jgi:Putative prokaryotic signal transducing protein
MWTCPKCATKVDPTFDVCWACGTSVDGTEDPSFVPADADVAETGSPLEMLAPEVIEPFDPAESDLVEAYRALDLMQAKFLADRLTEAGVPAMSDTHDLHDAMGSMSSGPRVWVRAGDLARAKAWLEDYDRREGAERESREAD